MGKNLNTLKNIANIFILHTLAVIGLFDPIAWFILSFWSLLVTFALYKNNDFWLKFLVADKYRLPSNRKTITVTILFAVLFFVAGIIGFTDN